VWGLKEYDRYMGQMFVCITLKSVKGIKTTNQQILVVGVQDFKCVTVQLLCKRAT
jgi:hypothetical protein